MAVIFLMFFYVISKATSQEKLNNQHFLCDVTIAKKNYIPIVSRINNKASK